LTGGSGVTTPDWSAIESHYRAGTLSIREIARQNGVSDTAIRKQARKAGWTKDLSARVRIQVRESLVREGSRQCELAGIKPSDAAIVDEAAAMGVAVVRSHRYDINALRQAAAGLLDDVRSDPGLKVTERARVIAELAMAYARLVPLERQAFGLDEDRPQGSQPMTVVWEGMPQPAYD
jgi:hypothetical protein